MHFHTWSQNLTGDEPGGRRGPMWRHGRAALWLYDDAETAQQLGVEAEWKVPSGHFHLSLNVDGTEREITLSVGCGLFSLYLTAENLIRFSMLEREIRFSLFDGSLMVTLWMHPHDWNSTEPKWRRFTVDPARILFGRTIYSRRVLSEHAVTVPMPERSYAGTVTLTEDTWRRPRWPFPTRVRRAKVEMKEPIPFPGKGENSWDQGDDALHGLTFPAATVPEAISGVVASVLRSREKYGHLGWVPAQPSP